MGPIGGEFAGLIRLTTVGAYVLGAIVHVGFAAGVWSDGRALRRRREGTTFVGPGLWAIATLIGGVFVALADWTVHHSTLRAAGPGKPAPDDPFGLG